MKSRRSAKDGRKYQCHHPPKNKKIKLARGEGPQGDTNSSHNIDHSKSPNLSVPAETFPWMHEQAARPGLGNDLLLRAAGIDQKKANKADL